MAPSRGDGADDLLKKIVDAACVGANDLFNLLQAVELFCALLQGLLNR
jgi:hypothetical protein